MESVDDEEVVAIQGKQRDYPDNTPVDEQRRAFWLLQFLEDTSKVDKAIQDAAKCVRYVESGDISKPELKVVDGAKKQGLTVA